MRGHLREITPAELSKRLRDAPVVTATLMQEIIEHGCRRVLPSRSTARTARIECLIAAAAWTEAGVALIELELTQWQLRRIAYDSGEWHCALSRERELPDWLDQSIDARHPDLALAILTALVDTLRTVAPRPRTSVPLVPRGADVASTPVCCDNFS